MKTELLDRKNNVITLLIERERKRETERESDGEREIQNAREIQNERKRDYVNDYYFTLSEFVQLV